MFGLLRVSVSVLPVVVVAATVFVSSGDVQAMDDDGIIQVYSCDPGMIELGEGPNMVCIPEDGGGGGGGGDGPGGGDHDGSGPGGRTRTTARPRSGVASSGASSARRPGRPAVSRRSWQRRRAGRTPRRWRLPAATSCDQVG